MLLALVIFLLGVPIADDLNVLGSPVMRILTFSFLLGVGVLSLKGSGKPFAIAMFFVVAGIIMNIASARTSVSWMNYAALIFKLGFLLTAVYFTFIRIATDSQISVNRIVGAIAVYLLLGVMWAVAYMLLEMSVANSFTGTNLANSAHWDSDWLYFSFVTMTTLGYGDIAPVSALARTLAYMQAVFGQFYIAILVAGLVSAYISKRN